MTFYKYKFDFEIGTLKQSPCKDCPYRQEFPKCFEDCTILDELRNILSETRSCTKTADS